MNASHVCSTCRRNLLQLRNEKLRQWQLRATFISLSTPPTTTRTSNDIKERIDQRAPVKEPNSSHEQLPQLRRAKKKYPGFSPEAGDVLESLFTESAQAIPSVHRQFTPPAAKFDSYKNIDTLNRMIADGPRMLPAAWKFFVDHFGPEARGIHATERKSSPTFMKHSCQRLMHNMIQAKAEDPFSAELPTVTDITRVYMCIFMMQGRDWISLMYGLLDGITRALQSNLPDYTHETDERLIQDLLGSWNLMCRRVPLPWGRQPPGAHLNWSQIPQFSSLDVERGVAKNGGLYGFGFLLPQIRSRQLSGTPLVVIATYAHLKHVARESTGVAASASDLLSALEKVISVVEFDLSFLKDSPQAPPILRAFVQDESQAVRQKASKAISALPKQEQMPTISPPGHQGSKPVSRHQFPLHRPDDPIIINKKIHDAIKRRDLRSIDDLWDEVRAWPVSTELDRPRPGSVNLALCNYFILAYTGLRQPNRAIEVWNFMVKHDLTPNLSTWDAMLNGCKNGRDWKGLEDVWLKMLNMGIMPDGVCWTSRIGGLLACRKVDEGLRALDQMGHLWLATAQRQYGSDQTLPQLRSKTVQKAIKPTIETVNATISGLLNLPQPREDLVRHVLNWAANFDIEPDVLTYNTLLRPLIRQGRTKEASEVLASMAGAGIQADVATFTTILDETFRDTNEKSVEEQKEIVAFTFSEMEAAGVKANLHTYGKIIYALLEGNSGDMTVVNTVLARMERENIQPSTYIYTSLVNYYFNQDPPQIEEVKALLERARMEPGSVDNIFWDRVMEGFARAGFTSIALKILSQKEDIGDRSSWTSLQTLLNALAKNGEWEIAKAVVRDVRDEDWARMDLEKGLHSAHKFWKLAAELNLLD